MAKITMYIREVTIEELKKKYYDKEKYQGYCRECNSYNKKHSCPPFSEEEDYMLDNYNYIHIVVAKLEYSKDEIEMHKGSDKTYEYTKKTFFPVKNYIHERMIKLEGQYENAYYSAMGSCALCEVCEKVEGKDCRYPDKMRISLEAWGYDIGGMLKDYFDIDIKWASDGLPEYYSLLGGIASVDRISISEELIKSIGQEALTILEL